MFRTLKTLMDGAQARADDQLRDRFAIELIDQKIREATAALKSAKLTLASLVQRERMERRQADDLAARIGDLMERAGQALAAGREDLAQEGAEAIARLEHEAGTRAATLARLERQVRQLRQSVEAANRRLIDLQQGAVAARAAKREAEMQIRLGATNPEDAFAEAEALIARVLNRDDPVETSAILGEIDRELDRSTAAEKLADAGFGAPMAGAAEDVMARLRADQTPAKSKPSKT